MLYVNGFYYFNPLSLYRERHHIFLALVRLDPFQSTLPIQGETEVLVQRRNQEAISIHSPYTGRDGSKGAWHIHVVVFQSTLPIQGETIFYDALEIF